MASNTRGLGNRDLGAARQQAHQQRLIQGAPSLVSVDDLVPSPENGRDMREEAADPRAWERVKALSEALKTDGVNTALTVVPAAVYLKEYPQHQAGIEGAGKPYVVIHGHRRLAAARLAGLRELPVLVRQQVVSIRIAAIQENMLRERLDPVQEGQQFQLAMREENLSQRALAARVGVSQTTVSHRIALLTTIPEVQAKVVDDFYGGGGIGLRFAAGVLARLRPELQLAFVKWDLSMPEAERLSKLPVEQQLWNPGSDAADVPAADGVGPEVIAVQSPAPGPAVAAEPLVPDAVAAMPAPRAEAEQPQPAAVPAVQAPASQLVGAPAGAGTAPAAGPEVIAVQSPAPTPVAAAANVPQAATRPAGLILVGEPTAEEIAQSLIDQLPAEVLAEVRDYLT